MTQSEIITSTVASATGSFSISPLRREEIVGKTVFEVSPQNFAQTYRDKDLDLLNDPVGVQVYESQVRHGDGSLHDVVFHKARMTGDDGKPSGIIGVILDITQRKQAEQQIHQLAFFDTLTGLPNRRLLMDRLNQELAIGARTSRYGAILFLDLDNFKTLNDSKGHDIGDLLLVEVARRLSACVRDGDTVARLGGDEFVVVLESLNAVAPDAAKHAEQVAEKIRAALSEPYMLNQHEYHSTPSIGVALFCGHQDSLDNLLKYADTAMYQAKTAGRNAIRFYDPEMQAAIEARADLEEELRKALAGQQFRLHYQIQVDSLGRPLGAEVLLRWQHLPIAAASLAIGEEGRPYEPLIRPVHGRLGRRLRRQTATAPCRRAGPLGRADVPRAVSPGISDPDHLLAADECR